MDKRKVSITIDGKELNIVTDETLEHVSMVADKINDSIRNVKMKGGNLTTMMIYQLALLTLADAGVKGEAVRSELEEKAKMLDLIPHLEEKVEMLEGQIENLKDKNQKSEEKIFYLQRKLTDKEEELIFAKKELEEFIEELDA